MSSEMICPVCHFGHIPRDKDTCPQCDSDLICFKLLDALADLPMDSKQDPSDKAFKQIPGREGSGSDAGRTTKSKIPWVAFLLGGFLLILVCFVGYASQRFLAMESMVEKIESHLVQTTTAFNKNPNTLIKTLKAGTEQMNHLEKRVEKRVEKLVGMAKENELRLTRILMKKENRSKISENQDKRESTCFNIYRAKEEDTLWTIARDLYGSGIFYPVLMENNPKLSVYSIGSKDSIRYMCDKTRVASVYKTIIGYKQNRPFWKYRVRPGDTRKGIIKRYCLNQKDCLVEDKLLKPVLKPVLEPVLEPGMTIGVFLE